jgi:dihydroorotate dehydrogenase electron transfer subunit
MPHAVPRERPLLNDRPLVDRLVAVVERREIVPGLWLHAWHAPGVVAGVRAGQYVHLRTVEPGGLPVRRPLAIATADPASGTLTTHAPGAPPSGGWSGAIRVGDTADLIGPLGRPFEVDPRSRHLLLVAEGAAIGSLRLLVDEAIREGRSVVLLYGTTSSSQVYPSRLLPDEVEYIVATEDGSLGHRGSVLDLVLDYEAWADQSFAAGPAALLGALANLAAGRRQRMGVATLGRKRGGGKPVAAGSPEARRKAFLQVIPEQRIGCAAGTCLGCTVMGASGVPQRVCREGPAFAADELQWDERP